MSERPADTSYAELIARLPIVRGAVRREREACARVAERLAWSNQNTWALGPEQNCMRVAAALRAREK